MKEELGREVDMEKVNEKLKKNFEDVFNVSIINHQKSFDR